MKKDIISTASVSHFTKFNTICKILKTRCFLPHYCLENYDYMNWDKVIAMNVSALEEPLVMANPIVCFTDLPHDKWKIHKRHYGTCVITLKEKWKLYNQLSPVIYLTKKDLLSNSLIPQCIRINILYSEELKRQNNPFANKYLNFANLLFIYLKLYEDNEYKYYDEREWRFVPWQGLDGLPLCLSKEVFDDPIKRDFYNREMWKDKRNLLFFDFDDIDLIEVKTNNQKDKIVEILTKNYGVTKVQANKIINVEAKF